MSEVCEAVYENGVFKPTGVPLNIKEGQRVNIVCDDKFEMKPKVYATPDEILAAFQSFYDGWTPEEFAEFEAIALDRSNFRSRLD